MDSRSNDDGPAGRSSLFRAAASLLAAVIPGAAGADLSVGDPAPAFTLRGSDGQEYTLRALVGEGKGGLVLAWFPKAFTPG